MAMIDPERERQRLTEFYAGQMDGELEKVARQAYELTGLAREALRAELDRRGLSIDLVGQRPVTPAPPPMPGDPPPEPPPVEPVVDGEIEMGDMVAIHQFRDLPEALLAKGGLESAGIEVALVDDNIVRLDWLWSNLMGGVKLLVKSEDADAAREILDQPIPEDLEVAGVGEYRQPRCPKCGSLDINFQELDPAAYLSLAVSVPIPFHRRAWRCHSCRAEWEDDGVPNPTGSST
ncbi:MAG: hypothetical protein ACLQBK_14430 [Candidatus Sulfotelmatobacter sp.]